MSDSKKVVRLSAATLKQISGYAKARNIDVSEAVDRLVTTALGRLAAIARYSKAHPDGKAKKTAKTAKKSAKKAKAAKAAKSKAKTAAKAKVSKSAKKAKAKPVKSPKPKAMAKTNLEAVRAKKALNGAAQTAVTA